MRLLPWGPGDLLRRLDDVLSVYGAAMGYSPELLATRRGYIAAHAHRQGFRAVASVTDEGTLAGFGYGYLSGPGQWWHDQICAALPRPDRIWLADCFELVELHVHPAAQGNGLGRTQLRALLEAAPGRTVLLSTPEADEATSRAWRLYRGFDFVDVLRGFRFPGDERAFGVLGRPLPLPSRV
ncbi:acetyltransferase [Pilimelia terevasa]|uniref:Acetyltransferase n=1 Tax=Pilimelia terevasa TaxID=53372 RepID=A0A8J3BQI7_9ACTN|nr:GNAT family N-acetyltransferase [Pilimelia terevasa]GGK26166.1 acetyltransferase [Pilimelia terevasa]